jgi:hypothetical protein
VSVSVSELKIKLVHARQQIEGAEDHVEREYWRLIADHWLELLRASAGDNDDQIQLKERAVVRLGRWCAVVNPVRSCHQLSIRVTALRQQPEGCQRDNATGRLMRDCEVTRPATFRRAESVMRELTDVHFTIIFSCFAGTQHRI